MPYRLQTANRNSKATPFGATLTFENLWNTYCQTYFPTLGFSPADVAISKKRLVDPILDERTTRILFTSGTADPWYPITLAAEPQDAEQRDIHLIRMPGSSHVADLAAIDPATATQTELQTRQAILEKIQAWIKNP